jgi:hypothetical protein
MTPSCARSRRTSAGCRRCSSKPDSATRSRSTPSAWPSWRESRMRTSCSRSTTPTPTTSSVLVVPAGGGQCGGTSGGVHPGPVGPARGLATPRASPVRRRPLGPHLQLPRRRHRHQQAPPPLGAGSTVDPEPTPAPSAQGATFHPSTGQRALPTSIVGVGRNSQGGRTPRVSLPRLAGRLTCENSRHACPPTALRPRLRRRQAERSGAQVMGQLPVVVEQPEPSFGSLRR